MLNEFGTQSSTLMSQQFNQTRYKHRVQTDMCPPATQLYMSDFVGQIHMLYEFTW